MPALQAVALTLVLLTAAAVVFTTDPLRQAVVNGLFGLLLVVLFVTLAAPDVAISQLVVSTVAYPLVLLAAIYKVRKGRTGRKHE